MIKNRLGKLIYRDKKTGEIIQTDIRLNIEKYELVYELKDTMIKNSDEIKIK